MTAAQKFLEKCSALKEKGCAFVLEQGMIVCRGFADLGYEEFVMLTNNKICSLYSGKISELPDEDKKHFFAVPDEGMLTDRIVKSGFDIRGMEFENQRIWKVLLQNPETHIEIMFEGPSIKDALLECLLAN